MRGGRAKLYRNTLIVFLLCGFWHGAAWHYVLWGLFQGVFLVIERIGLSRVLDLAPKPLRHAYALVVIMLGWVLFRAPSIPAAGAYFSALAGLGGAGSTEPIVPYLPADVVLALAVGIAASVPLRLPRSPIAEFACVAALFLASLALTSAQTFKPFIYFRF